jgi:hypothetical protein
MVIERKETGDEGEGKQGSDINHLSCNSQWRIIFHDRGWKHGQ